MKKALIVGAGGFVGNYLIDHIQRNCIWSINVTKMSHEKIDREGINVYDLDICDKAAVDTLLKEVHPDYIFHLAAQSSVATSWKSPGLTVDINVKGSLNLLEAVRELDYSPRVLLVGSGEEYGYVKSYQVPVDEETVLRPGNIYAATKACQNMLGAIYAKAYNMDIMMVRAFNHIGPNQAPVFVAADFCRQVAEIENNLREATINVGNLSAKRDFSDVRDVVRAYVMLMETGIAGEIYNVGSGKAISIQALLDIIISLSEKRIQVQVDDSRLRPIDVPIIEANIEKLKATTDWEPQILLEQTLKETLDYWRKMY